MELFAQRAGQQPPGAPDAGIVAGMLAFYAVVLVVAIVIQVMFLLTMSKCLKQISPRNRQMEPGMVWLCLIPIFGLVWTIIMILRVADSLRDEYDDRGMRGDGDYGKTIGIVYIVTAFLCGPVGLICWIMYWVKIAGYTKQLAARRGYAEDDDEDEEDDRPRKKRRRDEDDEDDEEDDRPRRRR
jgi:heme/copper-type cytochrome/quinol oxidase subunit 2